MVGAWISQGTALGLTAVGTLVLAGAAIVALASLWDSRQTRHATIMLDLSRRWDEQMAPSVRTLHFAYSRERVLILIRRVQNLRATEKELLDYLSLLAWPNLIETLGVLASERAISRRTIFAQWGAAIAESWKRWEEPVLLMRELEGHPGIYRGYEKLARSMRRRLRREKLLLQFRRRIAGIARARWLVAGGHDLQDTDPGSPCAYRGLMAPPPSRSRRSA